MKAVLRLERIADDYFWNKRHHAWDFKRELIYMKRLGPDKSPSWAARLLPGMKREFLRGTLDYERANSCGSRGIFEYFPMGDGVYEVNDRYRWDKVRRYFLLVQGGEKTEITRQEAEAWLEQNTKSI